MVKEAAGSVCYFRSCQCVGGQMVPSVVTTVMSIWRTSVNHFGHLDHFGHIWPTLESVGPFGTILGYSNLPFANFCPWESVQANFKLCLVNQSLLEWANAYSNVLQASTWLTHIFNAGQLWAQLAICHSTSAAPPQGGPACWVTIQQSLQGLSFQHEAVTWYLCLLWAEWDSFWPGSMFQQPWPSSHCLLVFSILGWPSSDSPELLS